MILVVSSHDAHDNMDFTPIVGVSPTHPDKQYSLALIEITQRYLLPKITNFIKPSPTLDPDQKVLEGIVKNGKEFNPGFDQLLNIAKKNNITMMIYLHPELVELDEQKYNSQGQEIINWSHKNNIKIISGLDRENKINFRDNIHLNQIGQKQLAKELLDIISSQNL